MIRCGGCGRFWPAGTVWCGRCRATLGVRLCEDGHPSARDARVCTTCGSKRLSKAVPSLNLRPVTSLATLGVLVLLLPVALSVFGHVAQLMGEAVRPALCVLFAWLVPAVAATVVLWPLLGPRGRSLLSDAWFLAFRVALLPARFLVGAVTSRLGRALPRGK